MFGFFRVMRNLFNTTLRRHHAQNVALKLDLYSLVCVNYPFVLFSFRFMHAHLHHTVTHALYVGLVFCHGKPEDPYRLLNCTHGALRPQMRK